jgi:NADH-quinone oxidoreductase subunit E
LASIKEATTRYPTNLAAMLPALHAAQAQLGHINADAELDVADALDVPLTRVHEAVTFYTMFYDKPVGKHKVKICRNLACRLRGADRIMAKAKAYLGIDFGETTADGLVTLETDECLASCGTGPMLWYNDTFVENLTEEKLEKFLGELS